MEIFIGAVAGSLVTFVGITVTMAPRHWEWYHESKADKETIRRLAEERDHYKNMSYPSEWGPTEEHDLRIKHVREPLWDNDDIIGGQVEHRFDDILEGDPL